MKSGDLVNFHTSAWILVEVKAVYANPGIILRTHQTHAGALKADVFWADGKVTTEHESFLRAA